MANNSLGRRMQLWLLGYIALLTAVLFFSSQYIHERAEHVVWRALLNTELDSIVARSDNEPDYRWQDSDTLRLFHDDAIDGHDLPEELRGLHPGLHDGVIVQGRRSAVMVRDAGRLGRLALALDITDFEALENFVKRWSLLVSIVLILVTLLVASLATRRLVRPLSRLAERIGALKPESTRQRIEVDPHGSSELFVIADALNDYLRRNEQFVERERVFIGSASHELRTPVAVIVGAAGLALEQPGLPPPAQEQMLRVRRAAQGIEELVSLLLLLARDPARLAAISDVVALDRLIPEIVADHQHLTRGKDLQLVLAPLPPCEIVAPLGVVQVAIGNLLRNAIEHSDRGRIGISLSDAGVVTIEDPGHGMAPEEISRLYAQLARGPEGKLPGIGLELITRLCNHLGWRLHLQSGPGQGTRAVLDFSAALARDAASPAGDV